MTDATAVPAPTEKHPTIPDSVQLGLRLVRERSHFTTRRLQVAIGKLQGRRFFDKGYTNGVITKVENGEVPLKYGYLEGLARITGIPCGVLFVCTRGMSEVRDGRFDDAVRFALGLEKLAHIIKARAKAGKKKSAADLQALPNESKTLSPTEQEDFLEELFGAWEAHGLYKPETSVATIATK